MNQEICPKCKGKGKITTIFETKIVAGGETITLNSQKGSTEKCDLCKGSGFIEDKSK